MPYLPCMPCTENVIERNSLAIQICILNTHVYITMLMQPYILPGALSCRVTTDDVDQTLNHVT